jgi:hypothetical protein
MFTLDVMKISLSSYAHMWMIVYLLKTIYHFLQQQNLSYQKNLTWPTMVVLDTLLVYKFIEIGKKEKLICLKNLIHT